MIGTALAIGLAAAGAAGSLGGAAIAAHGANKAASAQAGAADYAAQLQKQAADQALAENRRQFDIGQQNLSPWLSSGRNALSTMSYLMGQPNPVPNFTGGAGPGVGAPAAGGGIPDVSGMNFGQAISTGNPNISPNQETTDMWSSQGVPFHNVMTADGRMVAVRDDGGTASQTQSPMGAQDGTYQIQNNPAFDTASATSGIDRTANPNADGTPGAPAGANGLPSGYLMQPWGQSFTAPELSETTDPGYKARLQLAQEALERSAAAKGNLLTGGTAQAEGQLAQDYASNEYNSVYGRALQTYNTNYNTFNQDRSNIFNRLAAISGTGQTTANELNAQGTQFASNVGNIELGTATNIGQTAQNAAAARGSAYQTGGNAFGSAVSGIPGGIMNLYLMSKLLGGGATSPYGNPGAPTFLAGG
jgi:hypothetical protein